MPRRLLLDIEGDGLLPSVTKVHCIAAVDVDAPQHRFDWKPTELTEALETLDTADVQIAHFGLGYDWPALEKVLGYKPRQGIIKRDTHVISRLIFPNLNDTDGDLVLAKKLPGKLHGKHSIKAWGYRLGEHKGDYADVKEAEARAKGLEDPEAISRYVWGEWNQEMHAYMVQDISTTLALWNHLDPDKYSQQAIELEHRIAQVCNWMQECGWPFDRAKAADLQAELSDKRDRLAKELIAEFGFWFEPKGKKTLNEHGVVPWDTPKRDDKARGYVKGQPVTKLEKVWFNPGSRPHIIKCLTKLGWKPTVFTDNGNPALDDEVLESLSEQFPSGTKLVEYLLLSKRIGQIATGDKAWLKSVQADGCVHGTTNPMGTSTSRAAHYDPNLGQVPASKNPYGRECRELFTVKPGFVLVGADQSSLQLRCLGHYLHPYDNGAFGDAVAHGDPHWRVVQALGLTDEARDEHNGLHEILREKGAKTFTYATVFGCFPEKAGAIIRDCCVTARNANPEWGFVYDRFFGQGQSNKQVGGPAREAYYAKLGLGGLLGKLKGIRALRHRWSGSVPGLDGRFVPTRSDHSSLAALLQSCEAILCKTWVCNTYDALVAKGYRPGWDGDFVFVGWVHDEVQIAVRSGLEQEVGEIVVTCAKRAGDAYGFRVPLASSFKIGPDWSCTH